MVSSFVSAVTLMLAFIFGPPVGYARLHKRDGLSLGEGRFYCTYCAYRYIRTKLHPPHLSIKDIQSHQQVHRALSFVLKLIARNLPRAHFLRRLEAGEGPNVRFLVNTNQHVALLVQVPDPLVAPQNLRCTSGELFVNARGLQ